MKKIKNLFLLSLLCASATFVKASHEVQSACQFPSRSLYRNDESYLNSECSPSLLRYDPSLYEYEPSLNGYSPSLNRKSPPSNAQALREELKKMKAKISLCFSTREEIPGLPFDEKMKLEGYRMHISIKASIQFLKKKLLEAPTEIERIKYEQAIKDLENGRFEIVSKSEKRDLQEKLNEAKTNLNKALYDLNKSQEDVKIANDKWMEALKINSNQNANLNPSQAHEETLATLKNQIATNNHLKEALDKTNIELDLAHKRAWEFGVSLSCKEKDYDKLVENYIKAKIDLDKSCAFLKKFEEEVENDRRSCLDALVSMSMQIQRERNKPDSTVFLPENSSFYSVSENDTNSMNYNNPQNIEERIEQMTKKTKIHNETLKRLAHQMNNSTKLK